jgi:hypothetical protein
MTTPDYGARLGRHLPHPAHLDAQVMHLQVHGDAMWMEHRVEGIGHLLYHILA